MNSTRKLTELFRALGEADNVKAIRIAQEICDLEREKGHSNVAKTLSGALNGSVLKTDLLSFNNQSESILQSGLVRLDVSVELADVSLRSETSKLIDGLCLEWQNTELLLKHGVMPRNKLLFEGPSGCGKTITARAIARELGMPIYMLKFDAVIGSYLGQTAANLREIFKFVGATKCILLLDEVDALGKQRGDSRDVGELDRIAISLFQELEHTVPKGLVLATTNIPEQLDPALSRRFDMSIEFKKPTQKLLLDYSNNYARKLNFDLPVGFKKQVVKVDSFSTAEKLVLDEFRRSILAVC
jgi:AAA+ superfamily predicted ATPase